MGNRAYVNAETDTEGDMSRPPNWARLIKNTDSQYELADDELETDGAPIIERKFVLSNGEVVLFLQSDNSTDNSALVGETVSDGVNTTTIVQELFV